MPDFLEPLQRHLLQIAFWDKCQQQLPTPLSLTRERAYLKLSACIQSFDTCSSRLIHERLALVVCPHPRSSRDSESNEINLGFIKWQKFEHVNSMRYSLASSDSTSTGWPLKSREQYHHNVETFFEAAYLEKTSRDFPPTKFLEVRYSYSSHTESWEGNFTWLSLHPVFLNYKISSIA